MPDFAKIMAVALLLLAGLFILTSPQFYKGPSPSPGKIYVFPSVEEETPSSGEKGHALPTFKTEVKHIYLAKNLRVSFLKGKKTLFSENNITIANGFGKRKFYIKDFSLESPELIEKSEIELRIIDSNYYGVFEIYLNGEKIYSGYPQRGKIIIPVNVSLLKALNTLQIFCGSSTWRLWAPTTWILSFNFSVYYLDLKKQTLPFLIGDEFEGIKTIRILWYAQDISGNGSLVVKINGNEIYRGRDYAPMIDLKPEEVNLKKGVNEIEFFAGRDTEFILKDVEIILFYEVYPALIFNYTISEEDYEIIKERNATLRFTIAKMEGDIISLTIKITDAKGNERMIIPQAILREGEEYRIVLTSKELAIGNNTIEFKVNGDGKILLGDVKLEI